MKNSIINHVLEKYDVKLPIDSQDYKNHDESYFLSPTEFRFLYNFLVIVLGKSSHEALNQIKYINKSFYDTNKYRWGSNIGPGKFLVSLIVTEDLKSALSSVIGGYLENDIRNCISSVDLMDGYQSEDLNPNYDFIEVKKRLNIILDKYRNI